MFVLVYAFNTISDLLIEIKVHEIVGYEREQVEKVRNTSHESINIHVDTQVKAHIIIREIFFPSSLTK